MSEYTHTYSLSSFPNGNVDVDKFRLEIEASSITSVFVGLQSFGSDCMVTFDVAANAATLDALVATHDGIPTPKAKALRYVMGVEDITSVNYVSGLSIRLHPKRSFSATVKGEVIGVEFYAQSTLEPDGVSRTYTDMIVSEAHAYLRDSGGVALTQTKTITWIDEADQVIFTKIRGPKIYDPDERMEEGKRRRNNHVNELQSTMLGMIMATEALDSTSAQILGIPFMSDASVKKGIEVYVQTGDASELSTVVSGIDTATEHMWLDNDLGAGATIKDYLLGELV